MKVRIWSEHTFYFSSANPERDKQIKEAKTPEELLKLIYGYNERQFVEDMMNGLHWKVTTR